MSLSSEYIPFAGGLDEASALTTPIRGRLIACENVEVLFGEDGLWTARGYERLDGRAAASGATYHRLDYSAGTGAFAPGDALATATGSARVLRVQGGVAGGVAAGLLVVTGLAGTMAPGQLLSVGGTPRATLAGLQQGGESDPDWVDDIAAARAWARSQITKVPGEGPVLGVAIYQGGVYALRNAVGGVTAALWRSSDTGWALQRAGLRPNGTMRARAANFSGSSAAAALFGCDGKNRYWKLDGTTFTFGPAVWGTEGSCVASLTPAAGTKVLAIAEAAKGWAVGAQVMAYSSSNAANFMTGTVTAWSAPNLTLNVSAFGGVAASDWHVCMVDGTDRPFDLAAHINHLMLAYPRGQLQTSDLGDPLVFGVTSSLIGVSDEIRALCTLRGAVLAIMQATKVDLLYGTGKETWTRTPHSESTGSRPGSIQEVGGNAIFVSDAGIMSLEATKDFGDFNAGELSTEAKKTFASLMRGYRCTALAKSVQQFRLYGDAGQVMAMTSIAAGGGFTPGRVAITRLRYPHQAVCSAHATVAGQDLLVFGTDEGWVMRDRVGTSFDGTDIAAFARTPYWHHRQPQRRKRWRKMILDAFGVEPARLSFRMDFDLAGARYAPGITHTSEVSPAGGTFDADDWDSFYWSEADATQIEAEPDGVGCNASVTLWTESSAEPVRLVAMTLLYSPLGAQR